MKVTTRIGIALGMAGFVGAWTWAYVSPEYGEATRILRDKSVQDATGGVRHFMISSFTLSRRQGGRSHLTLYVLGRERSGNLSISYLYQSQRAPVVQEVELDGKPIQLVDTLR